MGSTARTVASGGRHQSAANRIFGLWLEEGGERRIEYSRKAIEELRAHVIRNSTHSGRVEVGALLFGTRLGEVYRILAIRIIPCEYAFGPAFRLTARDEAGLQRMITDSGLQPETRDLQILGICVVRSRMGPQPTDEDRRIAQLFFPEGSLILAVLRPSRAGDFYVHFNVRTEKSALWMPLNPPLELERGPIPLPRFEPREAAPAQRAAGAVPASGNAVRRKGRFRGLLATVSMLLAAAGTSAFLYLKMQEYGVVAKPAAPVAIEATPLKSASLHVNQLQAGEVEISWIPPFDSALPVVLRIQDASGAAEITPNAQALNKGIFHYLPNGALDRVELRIGHPGQWVTRESVVLRPTLSK